MVLVTLDTLRYDRFAGDARTPSRMPQTMARARRGTEFVHFYSAAASTQPTHASIFTGLHPWEHGVIRNGAGLAPDERTVAEILRDAGFETRAVVASFPVTSSFGYAQGFDAFDEDFSRTVFKRMVRWEGVRIPVQDPPGGRSHIRPFFAQAELVTDLAIASIDAASAPKQFFWFHYFDPHAPYGASQGNELTRKPILDRARQGQDTSRVLARASALYDSDVQYLDGELERLFQRLDEDRGIFQTHVLITADHGESLGEGGSIGHSSRLSEEQIHVPTFLISPSVEPGRRDEVAGSVDVASTLLALAAVPAPPGLSGRDLTAPPAGPSRALGMRRVNRDDDSTEWRLDGLEHPLEPFWFYAVETGGEIARGNASVLMLPKSRSPAVANEPLHALFADLERRVKALPDGRALDAESRRGLQALGYLEAQ